MEDLLLVDSNYVEFGDIDYAPEIFHISPKIFVKNVSDLVVTMDSMVQYTNALEEFPVELKLNMLERVPKEISLQPNETIELSFLLLPDSDYMQRHSLGTSYFKVSRRFFLNYYSESGNIKSLSMSFAANLCISTLFLENPNVNIENKIAGEEFSHDIMIWNRSESNLYFRISDVSINKIGDSDEPIMVLSSNGIMIDLTNELVLSVPSFAPRIINIRMSSSIPGRFSFKCKFVNTRNASNTEVLDIQGSILEPKDMKQWKLIDEDNASVIDAQNNIRKLYLGELFFGQRMVRKFSVMNMGSSELRIELSRNASVNKEIRLSFLDDKDGEVLLEDNQPLVSNITPKTRENMTPTVVNVKNPYFPVWNDISQAESQRSWESFEPASQSAANPTAAVSISKLCMRLFSQEYVENGDEEDLNFGLFRPLHSQRNQNNLVHAKSGLIKRMTAKVFHIPVGGKVTLVAEVCPSQEHHENLSHEYAQLMKRVTEVRIMSSFLGDDTPPESLLKETISFEYRACMCKISVSPPSQTLGECHIGESYKVPITFTNLSELAVNLKPVIASSGCEISSFGEIKLAALEKKNVTIRLVPTIETPHFIATIRFRSLVGMVEGEVEVTGKSTSAMPLRFHNLFYQVHGSLVRNKHQLHFGRVLCNMKNYAKLRVKNISRMPLRLSFWNDVALRLRMASVAVESSLDQAPVLKAVSSFDHEASDLMRSDIEELKWGLSFNENTSFPAPKSVGAKGDGKALVLSSNVEALDVTPLQSKRSSDYNRRYGSLGHERALMERYTELHHLASFQDIGAELSKEKEKEREHSHLLRSSNRTDSSTREMIDTMKKLVFPWLFRELDTDKLITDIEDAEVVASFAHFSNQDCVRPFLSQQSSNNSSNMDNDEQEKARAAQDLQQRLESWFAKNYVQILPNDSMRSEGISVNYVDGIDIKLLPGEERDVIFELQPSFNEESDIDGKLFNSSIIAQVDSLEAGVMQQMLSEAVQEDPDLEKVIQSDPNAVKRLSIYSIPIHYQAFSAEFAIIPHSLNFGRTIVGDTVVRYLRIVNKSPLNCPFVIEKSGSIASGFLSITGGRKGIVPPLSSVNLEIRFKPSMPFILEEDLKIRNMINTQNDQIVPMKSKVLRTDTFAIALQEEVSQEQESKNISNNEEIVSNNTPPSLSMQNMIDQEYRDSFNLLLSFLSGDSKPASNNTNSSLSTSLSAGAISSAATATTNISPTVNSSSSNSSALFKYMGSSAVGRNPTIVVKFVLRNMTSRTRQFIVDSTSNDAVELLDMSQLAQLHDVNEDKALELMNNLKALVAHPHNFPPIPEVLQNVLCMRCHFSSRLEKQQRINLQTVEEDESLQQLLDQLEKMQQKLKIALRKNKAEKIVKYKKKVEDCIQQLASKAYSKPSSNETSSNKNKKKNMDSKPSTSTMMITEDTELAHFVELAPEEEVHIEMRLSYLPSAQYRLWKGLLPFIGRVRVFEVRHEDIKKTLYFGTMLYASTIEMSSTSDISRSRLNSFESDVNSEASSVGFDRKMNLANIKEVDAKSAPFLVTIPLWCSMMTKHVYPKYKKIPLNTLGGSVKLSKSRKDNSMSGTFMITSFHGKYGQLEILIDEKFIPVQIVTENKTITMKDYGRMMIKLQESSASSSGYGLDTSSAGSLSSPTKAKEKDAGAPYHDLSTKRFVIPLSQRARKTFSLRWNPSQFVELPVEEFKLIGALKVTYGATDNTYYSLLLPFVCAYQHKSIIEVDKYCSLGERCIGSYYTLQFTIKNTSTTEELHYIVTAESSDAQTAKGFIEIIAGKSGVIHPGDSKNVSILFTATALGRFSQKLWVQNIRDGFDQRRVVAQANVIVSPSRFVVFPDLEPSSDSVLSTNKKKDIDFGLVEIQEDEMVYCECQYDNMLADSTNGLYILNIKNVSTSRLSVTAVSNLRKQCFIFADKEGSIPAVNVLLPKGEVSCLYVFLRPTKVVDSTTTGNAGGNKTHPETTTATAATSASSSSALTVMDFQREVTGGIRLVFFSAETDVTQLTDTANSDIVSASSPEKMQSPVNAITSNTTSLTEEILVHRKLFETALSFRATVGKSIVKAHFVADDIYNVRVREKARTEEEDNNCKGEDENAPRIPLKIRNESQCFPLRYWLCTCSRSSYSGSSVFRLLQDEDRTGYLKPTQDIVTSIAIERGDELVGITYKHLRVHNLGANESTEVAKMLHFPSDDLSVKLVVLDETLTCYVRVKHLSNITASQVEDNRDAFVSTLPYSRPMQCEIHLQNTSSHPMALYPVSNLPIRLQVKDAVQHQIDIAELGTIDLAASQSRVEELVNGFSRNLKLQSIMIPSYRLGKFHLCGDALAIQPGQKVTFTVSSLAEYGGDWFLTNDLRRLTHSQILDLMGFLGFMCLNITANTVHGNDIYEVVPPENRRFTDHSYLALRGGIRLPMKIFSPRINVKPREIKLGKLTSSSLADGSGLSDDHEASKASLMTTEMEFSNKTVSDILCILEISSPWVTGISAVLSLEDGTVLEGEQWSVFNDGKLYLHEFAPNDRAKLQLTISTKLLVSDSYIQVHSFAKEAVSVCNPFTRSDSTENKDCNTYDLSALETFRIASQKVKVHFESESVLPAKGFSVSVADNKSSLILHSTAAGNEGDDSLLVNSSSSSNKILANITNNNSTSSSNGTTTLSEGKLSVLFGEAMSLPRIPTQDVLSFKEKSGVMTRKTCKFTVKNLSKRHAVVHAQFTPLSRFAQLVDTEVSFSNSEEPMTWMEIDESCQLKVKVGFVENFKVTKKLLEGMKPVIIPSELDTFVQNNNSNANANWSDLLTLFPSSNSHSKAEDVYLISSDKHRLLLKVGTGTVNMVPTPGSEKVKHQTSSHKHINHHAHPFMSRDESFHHSRDMTPITTPGSNLNNNANVNRDNNVGISYTESIDLYITLVLEPTLIPVFDDSLLSMMSPIKTIKTGVLGDEEDDEAIHFLFCGSLENDDAIFDAHDQTPFDSTGYNLLPANVSHSLYQPQYCSLLEDSQVFYLHNLTTSPYKFRMKSESIRFPGLRMLFPQSSFVGCRPPMEIWTDTIRLSFEPEMGEIEPSSMLQVRAFFIPASPSEAKCVTAPTNTEFVTPSTGMTSSTGTGHGNTIPSTGSISSNVNLANNADNQLATSVLYKSFTLRGDILDREDSLHPPVHIAATLIIDRAIPLLKSQPISETNRKKKPLDLVLTDDATLSNPTSTPANNHLFSRDESYNNINTTNNANILHTNSTSSHNLFSQVGSAESLSATSMVVIPSSQSLSTMLPHPPLLPSSSSTALTPSNINVTPQISSNPASSSTSALPNAISPNTVNNNNSSGNNNATATRVVRLRKRGITPHPTSPYHGYIDLGKQVERTDALEWAVTLENRSNEYTQYFELHALSSPPTEDWIVFSQNGGIIDKNGSSTFMLYFIRSQIGRYVSYLLIRDMHQRDRDHIICITMEVIADQRRQAALGLSLAFPSISNLSTAGNTISNGPTNPSNSNTSNNNIATSISNNNNNGNSNNNNNNNSNNNEGTEGLRGASYAEIWWQRFVDVNISHTDTHNAAVHPANAAYTGSEAYFQQSIAASPIPPTFDAISPPQGHVTTAGASPITWIRLKNLSDIILQFYCTQPSFLTVTPMDLVSYQRSVDSEGHELYRVLPKETIVIKVTVNDDWQLHQSPPSQSVETLSGNTQSVLNLSTSSQSLDFHYTGSSPHLPILTHSLSGINTSNSHHHNNQAISSPYRSGSNSPIHFSQPQPSSNNNINTTTTTAVAQSSHNSSVLVSSHPSSPGGGNHVLPPPAMTLPSVNSHAHFLQPSLQSSPSAHHATLAAAVSSKAVFVTCHCALFDNLSLQFPVMMPAILPTNSK